MSIAEPINHVVPSTSEQAWARVTRSAPRLTETVNRYLAQIAVSSRPNTVGKAEQSLRSFALHLVDEHPEVKSFADVGRVEVETFKLALHQHRTAAGRGYSVNTLRTTLGMVRTFFDRIIEWDWLDAPPRPPLHATDLPAAVDPLPKFLDDADAARLMRAAQQAEPFDRLVVTLLARTGLRVGELCALQADALVRSDGGWWLRVPLGKLRNDRYVPVLPELLELLVDWQTAHGQNHDGLLLHRHGRRVDRHTVTRSINRVARAAGLGHVHPHQLRHTLATQAINRGMRLEAIAALLGHRSLRMTMVYARIANRTVAEEYHAAAAKVDALYAEPEPLAETDEMRVLRHEHRRMLGNGYCTRPRHLDCSFEAICEGCGFYETTIEFKPTLRRQRDHAATHDQPARQQLYQRLLDSLDERPA